MRRYIDLTEGLTEAPISDFQLVGDFEKSSSIRKPVDRKLLSNEKAVRKITAQWARTEQDFNFYFVNMPEARGKTEVGMVSPEWLAENLPKTTEVFKYERDAINVIFTNNSADQHIPMTGWIIAHRLSHAMDRLDQVHLVGEARNRILEIMGAILRDGYNLKSAPDSVRSWRSARQFQNINWDIVYRRFYEAIGTMRSARERKIRNEFEFLHELFAQYLLTGKIRFNPLPRHFSFRIGNENSGASMQNENDMDYYNGLLEDLAEELGYTIDNILGSCVGKIFVM